MLFLRSRKPAIYACMAMLVTQALSVAEAKQPGDGPTDHLTGILDIALATGGTLQGTVINEQGTASPHRRVIVSQGRFVAEARSNAQGEFWLTGLPGGLCTVAVDGRQRAYRVWAPGTAPPCAINELLVVGGSNTVRAQLVSSSNRQWFVENAGQIAIITTFIALPIVYATKPYGS